MKTYIIGPSGSGKTTLAKQLSSDESIIHIDLDDMVYGQWQGEISSEKINQFIRNLPGNWVIEGIYVIDEVAALADRIIVLKVTLLQAIYRQWKRYLNQSEERKKYSLKSQIKLTINTIKEQYLEKQSVKPIANYIYTHAKVAELERKYSNKVLSNFDRI